MRRAIPIAVCWLLLLAAVPAAAQTVCELSIQFHRDFGYAAGSEIQGAFSMTADGPQDLIRVDYYLDDQLLGSAVGGAEQQGAEAYARVNRLVAETSPEDSPVLFLPFLYGSNAHPDATGTLVGLSSRCDRRHVLRAVYEGVVFAHQTHLERLLKFRDQPHCIRASGGATAECIGEHAPRCDAHVVVCRLLSIDVVPDDRDRGFVPVVSIESLGFGAEQRFQYPRSPCANGNGTARDDASFGSQVGNGQTCGLRHTRRQHQQHGCRLRVRERCDRQRIGEVVAAHEVGRVTDPAEPFDLAGDLRSSLVAVRAGYALHDVVVVERPGHIGGDRLLSANEHYSARAQTLQFVNEGGCHRGADEQQRRSVRSRESRCRERIREVRSSCDNHGVDRSVDERLP